jgi:hypothetical protein
LSDADKVDQLKKWTGAYDKAASKFEEKLKSKKLVMGSEGIK